LLGPARDVVEQVALRLGTQGRALSRDFGTRDEIAAEVAEVFVSNVSSRRVSNLPKSPEIGVAGVASGLFIRSISLYHELVAAHSSRSDHASWPAYDTDSREDPCYYEKSCSFLSSYQLRIPAYVSAACTLHIFRF
jgi:hypothetical protein